VEQIFDQNDYNFFFFHSQNEIKSHTYLKIFVIQRRTNYVFFQHSFPGRFCCGFYERCSMIGALPCIDSLTQTMHFSMWNDNFWTRFKRVSHMFIRDRKQQTEYGKFYKMALLCVCVYDDLWQNYNTGDIVRDIVHSTLCMLHVCLESVSCLLRYFNFFVPITTEIQEQNESSIMCILVYERINLDFIFFSESDSETDLKHKDQQFGLRTHLEMRSGSAQDFQREN
jgi:hypothetical protein